MNKIILISAGILMPAIAAAHPSVVPHQHPHSISMLPDLAALLMAAIAVGAGAFVVARLRKGRP